MLVLMASELEDHLQKKAVAEHWQPLVHQLWLWLLNSDGVCTVCKVVVGVYPLHQVHLVSCSMNVVEFHLSKLEPNCTEEIKRVLVFILIPFSVEFPYVLTVFLKQSLFHFN